MSVKRENINQIFSLLQKQYPNPKTSLRYRNKFTLLLAVLLSAQCTDKNVNNVTKNIFKQYYRPNDFIKLGIKKIKNLIKSIGLYNTKAKNIFNLSKQISAKYKGKVPNTFDALYELPGVGRKTANVVLNEAFQKPTIAVDTHIFRVANRTRIAHGRNPDEVERNLLKIIPKKYIRKAHQQLLFHGRYTCKARKPLCYECIINKFCKFNNKIGL
jgi:endonuclease-3